MTIWFKKYRQKRKQSALRIENKALSTVKPIKIIFT